MARPAKQGLDYFPFDVDFFEDDKIAFVFARFGALGETIALKLLCKIYKDKGYYYQWGDDEALLFATRVVGDRTRHSLVNDVVHELVKRNFFDEDIFNSFKILTSKGIQSRYMKICEQLRRVSYGIKPELMLLDEQEIENLGGKKSFPVTKPQFPHDETPVSPRRKYTKEKKRKERIRKRENDAHAGDELSEIFKPPSVEEVQEFAESNNYFFDANEFVDYYNACGWKIGGSLKPMVDWRSMVLMWKKNKGKPNGKANGIQRKPNIGKQGIVAKREEFWGHEGVDSQSVS